MKGRLAAAAAAALLLAPAAAFAHGALRRSEPANGAHLDVAPRVLRLTFSERPELQFTVVRLLGRDGAEVALGPLTLDSARTVSAEIRGALVGGTYSVAWQMAGADGHPVRGRFFFTLAPGARGLAAQGPLGEPAGTVTPPGQLRPPAAHHDPVSMPDGEAFGAESPLYVAVRWLDYAALLVVLGVVAFRWVVLGVLRSRAPTARAGALVPLASTRAASLGLVAAGVLAVATLLRLLAQSYAMHGPSDALRGSYLGAMVAMTVWGRGWLLQVVGVVLAVAGFLAARRSHAGGWAVAALGAVALAFTPALSGHAASAPRLAGLAVLADGLHVLGAGGWLGSLLVVIGVGVPAALALVQEERGPAVADLVSAFSPTALAFAGVVAATGVFAAWLHLDSLPALWQSAYGRVLLVKLAVLSALVGTGAYNWLRVRPSLGDAEGGRRIRRSASAELVVGAVVLIVTAVLVATPTPLDTLAAR